MERLFDEMIHRPWGAGREARGWNPSVDLYETADAFVLEADLPGVGLENVKVEVPERRSCASEPAIPRSKPPWRALLHPGA